MAEHSKDTVDVELRQGGMLEFQRTGKYPEYLIVKSKKWGRRWKKDISGDQKGGVLHVKRKPMYTYRITDGEVSIFDMDGNAVEIDTYSIMMVD
tara:strand:+ start:24188 stop:24469 length:282 start_codon:yes stop_codon:yes gene_type:complete